MHNLRNISIVLLFISISIIILDQVYHTNFLDDAVAVIFIIPLSLAFGFAIFSIIHEQIVKFKQRQADKNKSSK